MADQSATILEEMHRIVREAAEPAQPGEGVKAAILRASRALRWQHSRVRQHWYRIARSVPAAEADHLRKERQRLLRERAMRLDRELQALLHELGEAERGVDRLHDTGVVAPCCTVRPGRGPAMADAAGQVDPLTEAAVSFPMLRCAS